MRDRFKLNRFHKRTPRSIKLRVRPEYNTCGYKLSNCDVCWTCHYFDFKTSKCVFMYQYTRTRTSFTHYIIKNPGWFRCVYWEEQYNEQKPTEGV